MASNGATIRLLRKFEDVKQIVVEIADDVFAVPPAAVATVRERFKNQPQILYFLDRNVVADEFYLNERGDIGWALRPASAPPVLRTALFDAVRPMKRDIGLMTSNVIEAAGFTEVNAVVKTYTCLSSPYKDRVIGYATRDTWRLKGKQRKLGPYALGDTMVLNDEDVVLPTAGYDSANFVWSGDPANIAKDVTDLSVFESKCEANPTFRTRVDELRKGLVVICGPALCDYAEFLPGFEWIVGDYADVADRVSAVLDGVKAKHSSEEAYKKAESAIAEMKAKAGAKMVAFRGSADFDPLTFWPETSMIPGISLETVPADPDYVTEETLARSKTDWYSGRWMLSAIDPSEGLNLISAGLAVVKAGDAYTIKPSSEDEVHIGTAEGISTVFILDLPMVVAGLLSAGAVIKWEDTDSFWFTNPAFDLEGYNLAKAAKAGDELMSDGVEFKIGDHLGECICARLLAEPVITPAEELLIIPTLSPQYFWTKYAREAPGLTPPPYPSDESEGTETAPPGDDSNGNEASDGASGIGGVQTP